MEIVESGGLTIFISNEPVEDGLAWSTSIEPGLWFGKLLRGRVGLEGSIVGECIWDQGMSACFFSKDPFSSHHVALETGEMSSIFLRIAPEDVEIVLGVDGLKVIDHFRTRSHWNLDEGDRNTFLATQALSWQIFGCQLSGASRRCYLTGKALEIVAHLLNSEWTANSDQRVHQTRRGLTWLPSDIERIHQARDLLLARLADPPSVADLGLKVGMNARKLSRGFNEFFGEPVYSYVKSRRLEAARLLLEAGETSVGHVARTFGYAPSHFATEFRKRFGVSPATLTGRRLPIPAAENAD
ncbi:MAG: AraC family transcriptional regulator [Pseudomonadota bacterium]